MKTHTTITDVDGLLLSTGKFIPIKNFEVALNTQDLSVTDKGGKTVLDGLSDIEKAEFYDYMICRWMAARENMFQIFWSVRSES